MPKRFEKFVGYCQTTDSGSWQFRSESSISGNTQFISLTKSRNMPGRFCIVRKIVKGGMHSAILQSYRLLLMEQKMAYI